MLALILEGYLLGWLVAWPPGPINAEMLRRVVRKGFLAGWLVGLGACAADFCWALLVGLGAGAVAGPLLTGVLGTVSVALLVLLAAVFLRGGWRDWQALRAGVAPAASTGALDSHRGGFLLGFGMALLSPWNLAFWLAVMGQQAAGNGLSLAGALVLASAVIGGALTWTVLYCLALRVGARWMTPRFQVATQCLTGILLLGFAGRTIARLLG